MCMHARMRRLVWSGDGTYVRIRRPWPARGKICACAFLDRKVKPVKMCMVHACVGMHIASDR